MSVLTLVINVPGRPVPAGSKIMVPTAQGRRIVDQNRASGKGQIWRKAIQAAAAEAIDNGIGNSDEWEPIEGPVRIRCLFVRQRPQRHYYSNGTLRSDIEPHPLMPPDLTKLVRGLEDALNGVVWKDDSQIIAQLIAKQWGDAWHTQCAVEWEDNGAA